MAKAAELYRYNRRVFIAPPWPEIFEQDRERKQTPEEAARTHDAMVATYFELGYDLAEIPRVPVDERVRFVVASSNPPPHSGGGEAPTAARVSPDSA
jgi:predicted ATPase